MRDPLNQSLHKSVPWIVLALGVTATIALWDRESRATSERASVAFASEIEQIHAAIERRALSHEQMLHGAATLVQAVGTLPVGGWEVFVRQAGRMDAMVGTTAMGYQLAGDAGEARSEVSGLESTDANVLAALKRLQTPPGKDRAAPIDSNRARIIDDTAIVPRNADSRAPGMLMIVPISPSAASSVAGRTTVGNAGYVFSYFRPEAFVGAALRDVQRESRIELFGTEAPQPGTALVDERSKSDDGSAGRGDELKSERTIRVADRVWLLRASASRAAFTAKTPALSIVGLSAAATLLGFAAMLLITILGRRATTQALQGAAESSRSLERFTSLFNTAPDAIIGLDRIGTIITFNHAAEHMFRVSTSEAGGKPLSIILPGMDIERITHALSDGLAVYESGFRTARVGVTAERRGGMRFPVELDLGELVDDQTSLITCIVRDVTEARRAEEEMRLYKRAIASSSNGIAIADVTLPDHPILYVNPSFERVTGYDLADALGRNCRFLQGPDTDPGAIAKIRSAIARGMECQVTLKNYMKDGTPFWNHLTLAPVRDRGGRVTHYIGIETDVTEIKQIEAALEERRQQLDAIFTLSPDGFVAIGRDRRISYANPAFLRITNLEHSAVQGAPIERLDELLKSGSDPANPFTPFAELLAEMGAGRGNTREVFVATSRFQDTVFLRNPTPKMLQRSIRRATGGSTEFVLYLRDVTREMEVDRMKSEFLSSAAHELRTPMASIYGFTELLLRRNFDEGTRRDLLQTIHKQAKHLTNLVNELLDLARIEARAGKDLKLEEQSLLPLINETIESLLVQNDSRVVDVTLPESLPLVRIDTGKMRQALTNILSNAYKYSPSGGRIELTTEIRSAGDRDFLGIRVHDEGIGMTPEQLAHACERFYRADTSGSIPGTGLGLSLVKEIMELQGGSIELQSESGKGTTVTLWLPVMLRIGVRAA